MSARGYFENSVVSAGSRALLLMLVHDLHGTKYFHVNRNTRVMSEMLCAESTKQL